VVTLRPPWSVRIRQRAQVRVSDASHACRLDDLNAGVRHRQNWPICASTQGWQLSAKNRKYSAGRSRSEIPIALRGDCWPRALRDIRRSGRGDDWRHPEAKQDANDRYELHDPDGAPARGGAVLRAHGAFGTLICTDRPPASSVLSTSTSARSGGSWFSEFILGSAARRQHGLRIWPLKCGNGSDPGTPRVYLDTGAAAGQPVAGRAPPPRVYCGQMDAYRNISLAGSGSSSSHDLVLQ
jgi:hypothetical protein